MMTKVECVGVMALALGVMHAVATETLVRRGDAYTVSNDTAVTEANIVRMLYGARGVVKTGAGAYTLPRGQFDAPNPLVVNAVAGDVTVTADGTLPEPTEPTAVLNTAAFWLDAAVNLQKDENDKILWWYDRRETKTGDVWGTSYVRAKTDLSPKDANSVAYTTTTPNEVTLEGMSLPMVYFGGFTTGTGMTFYQTNSTSSTSYTSIRHVYIVANFQESYGFMIGSPGGLMFHPSGFSSNTGLNCYYNSGDVNPKSSLGEFLVNGARLNPMFTTVKKGLQLIEIHAPVHDSMSAFGRLFNDRGIAGRWGGDYIGEVLVFNGTKTVLTEAERLQVSRYLMHKWGIAPAKGAVTVRLGENATVHVGDGAKTSVAGRGTVVRSGTETDHYIPTGRKPHEGVKVRLVDGTMKADVRELNLVLRAGDALSLSDDSFGVHTVNAASTAPVGQATITGATEAIRLGGVDGGITNLTVGAAEVILGDASVGGERLPSEVGLATVANGSFESGFSANDWVWSTPKNGSSGRIVVTNDSNVLDWRIGGGSDEHATLKANYRLSNFYATDGRYCFVLKQNNLFYGHVNVSRDGDYILSFDGTGRRNYDNMQIILSLVDGTEKTNTIACCTLPCGTGFRPYHFPVSGLRAGTYKLVVETKNGKATNGVTNDSHALLDNFRMDFVVDGVSSLGGVPVPNGSFENTRIMSASRSTTEFGTNQLACAGWTLTSPGAPIEGALAPASRLMTSEYAPAGNNCGEWQLRFHGSTGRATSDAFSLPAGRWKLRCKAAKWSFDGAKWNGVSNRESNPKVGVRVFVNDELAFDESSAALTVTAYEMTPVLFSNELVVTETDRIVLEFRQAATAGFMNLDDVEFIPSHAWGAGTELVTNGGFTQGDRGLGNWTVRNTIHEKTLKGGYEEHYGGEQCDDTMAICLVNAASVSQSIAFPAAGTYRLSFWSRSRVSHYGTGNPPNSHQYGGNILRAVLIDGSTTNRIVETPPVYSTNFTQTVAIFTVPSAGARTLCIGGVNDPSAGVWTGGNKSDSNVFLDCVSLKPAPQDDVVPELPEHLNLTLTGNTKLRLDYVGTNTLERLKIGLKSLVGVIDAATHPDLISGPGTIFVQPKGTILVFR